MPSSEQSNLLITRRGTIKGQLKRFGNFVQSFTAGGEINQLTIRKEKANDLWNEFQNVQQSIEDNIGETVDEDPYRVEFEELYFTVIAQCEKLIRKNTMENNELQNASIKSTSGVSSQVSMAKLSALNVPTFSGDYKQWDTFHDMFVSLIHRNETLTDVQRFFYLKTALTGEAADAIRSYEMSDKNYAIAWTGLVQRYNNKRILVQNHTKAIFELKPIERESSTKLRQFIDSLLGHTRALETLGYNTNNWGPLLIHVITTKLDTCTLREWETQSPKTEVSEVSDLIKFLQERFQILEAIESSRNINSRVESSNNKSKKRDSLGFQKMVAMHTAVDRAKCYACGENHPIYRCAKFLQFSVPERKEKVNQLNICIVCLAKHVKNKCKFKGCRKCGKDHNTLLHTESEETGLATAVSTVNAHAIRHIGKCSVLLSTAMIKIQNQANETVIARALLDSGSQSNFMTIELANKLQLPRKRVKFTIAGIDNSTGQANYSVTTTVLSRTTSYNEIFEFLILPKITSNLPTERVKTNNFNIPEFIELADPSYSVPGKVDVLIGAERFYEILRSGKYKMSESGLIFQETDLGWVAAGPIQKTSTTEVCSYLAQTEATFNDNNLETQISKFWCTEEITKNYIYSQEEKMCIEHFERTVSRQSDGRFVVELPFKKNAPELGESRATALKRFLALENRLQKNPKLREEYAKFINEYLELSHMEVSTTEENKNSNVKTYYMPHHAVLRDDSATTKLRVVFDASCPTSSGDSLNDLLLKGPSIQDELISLIVRFRTHRYVISADVTKMYRQIWIAEKDKQFQKILWRFIPQDEIKEYCLKTVTYGTKPASFMATSCLKKLADEHIKKYPISSEVIASDFYMDDLLSGAESLTEAIKLREEIIKILDGGGLQLRKWVSNNTQITGNILNDDSDPLRVLNLDNSPIKTLGLFWYPHQDIYVYKVNDLGNYNESKKTKRNILSAIATIFDPLGLIGPIIIIAKLIMQKLWKEKINWDENLPQSLSSEWDNYCRELPQIENILIPRRIIGCNEYVNIQIHGFSDASTIAYGACLYARATNTAGEHYTRLIVAKSRVAPLKVISLARLELCAAVLLVRLMEKIVPKLKINISKKYYWSDSAIVLSWINAPSSRWKTFVAHRVGEIHEYTNSSQWNHVKSENNPADIISRGCGPGKLKESVLWWEGPCWIRQNEENWPKKQIVINVDEIPEEKKNYTVTNTTIIEISIIDRFSSYTKLIRVVAYVMRWKLRTIDGRRFLTKTIETEEFIEAKFKSIRIVQQQYFQEEINCIKNAHYVPNKSKLRPLRPLLDSNNILRVGGRLNNAEYLPGDTRNPIILPATSTLTKLIFQHEHRNLLHAGPQALLAKIREQYWPLNGRNIAKKTVHKCIQCFRTKPIICQPILGDLPKGRVEAKRAFEVCGIDFAGPMLIKTSLQRNAKTVKTYICVFVCFTTKAIHIELVGDLSTNAFLAALRRFWSRRGMSKVIYSDNGTNFVGASRKLKEFRDLFLSDKHKKQVQECLTEIGVQWRFIPPRAPHFGGLWEAAVKSIKGHLSRVLGNAMLTYEELYTVLVRIESCLNSRPLTPLSSDPTDLNALTPAHFLVGGSLNEVPEADISDMSPNRLRRWQRTVQLTQQIWERWRMEYLTQLQGRSKWSKSMGQMLEDGMMVLVKDDSLPPLQWRLGRISKLLPGNDGVVRVAMVKTNKGEIKRAARTLCPLPIEK